MLSFFVQRKDAGEAGHQPTAKPKKAVGLRAATTGYG
jgi:hypothetical protein